MPGVDSPSTCIHPDAVAYAQQHEIPLPSYLTCRPDPQPTDQFQLVASDGLALQALNLGKVNPIRVDFVSGKLAHRRHYGGGRKQDLARACGLHQVNTMRILDATAGLGRDGFVLASLGAQVQLVERHAVLAALLADGLARAARSDDVILREIMARMTLVQGDATQIAADTLVAPDVIYLDPMFPARDKSARVKADMQALHRLLAGAEPQLEEETALLEWAQARADKRVVVKRPRLAPPLGLRPPDHQLIGKANRYDVYTFKRLTA